MRNRLSADRHEKLRDPLCYKTLPIYYSLNFRGVVILCWCCIAAVLALIPCRVRAQVPAEPVMWWEVESPSINAAADVKWLRPGAFRVFELNRQAMLGVLREAPREFAPRAPEDAVTVTLPMPDGRLARFRVVDSPVMAPELAAKYPQIKTFAGEGIDDATATVRLDATPTGVHAQIQSRQGMVCIDPQQPGNSLRHVSYYRRDGVKASHRFQCVANDNSPPMLRAAAGGSPASSADVGLHTFRLAVAATGEYTQFHGGTVADGLAAIVTAINRVNAIYESELAIRFVLVANNDLIVFTDPARDPYSDGDLAAMITQNQVTIDEVIGDANYDIGHVFGRGEGGYSWLNVVCNPWEKAKGATGKPAPGGEVFYVDYVAHEIGHQFGAHHTFNGTGGACFDGRSAQWAYERGSGSTIMAYAGICDSDDLQPHSDPYFHAASRDEILAYSEGVWGPVCATITPTGNHPPAVWVAAASIYYIPTSTPFTLTATGTDPDGDALSYCWEEMDLGPTQPLAELDNGLSPLFRSFPPTSSPSRTFPQITNILGNIPVESEKLPDLSRSMRFRVTARDNRTGGGGASSASIRVEVDENTGPFRVTSPAAAVTWFGTNTVEWDVAGTSGSPIDASTVDILLSTDGGLTFPIALATDTPNDGLEAVTLPDITTTLARIKVQAHGNIFFDISHGDFAIAPILDIRQINGLATVSWPASAAGWVLDEAVGPVPSANSPAWTGVPQATYQTNGNRVFASRSLAGGSRFYRLRRTAPAAGQ